jgi:hypothetical protein
VTPPSFGNRTRHFREAGLYVRDEGHRYTVISLAKGGVLSAFEDGRRIYSDHGLIARLADGRVAVTQLVDAYQAEIGEDTVSVQGDFGYASRLVPSPWRMVAFRLFTLTAGRFASNLVRRVLQRLLIVGKRRAPLRF